MKLPIYCDHCGELIGTFDTEVDTTIAWAKAPCGDKVCNECCDACAENHDSVSYSGCMYRNDRKQQKVR